MRLAKVFAIAASLTMAFHAPVAQAAACQSGQPGCVLPLPAPAAPPVVVPQAAVAAPVFVEEGGFNIVPYILGLIALAAVGYGIYTLVDDDGDSVSP